MRSGRAAKAARPLVYPLFATAFLKGLLYNRSRLSSWTGREWSDDGGIHRQRICAQYVDGLSALSGNSTAGGHSPAAPSISAGCAGRWRLCGGSVFAGMRFFSGGAGEACGGRLCDSDRLWRGGAFGKADAAAFCALLCLGGVRDGSGGTGRQRGSDGERNFLYGCGYKGFADCGWQCGFGIDSGFSCGGTSQYRRGSADGADLHGGKDYQARGTAG